MLNKENLKELIDCQKTTFNDFNFQDLQASTIQDFAKQINESLTEISLTGVVFKLSDAKKVIKERTDQLTKGFNLSKLQAKKLQYNFSKFLISLGILKENRK